MSNTTIYTFLDSIAFFKVFSKKEKESLASMNNIYLKFISGDFVIRENDHEEAVYILLKGNVIITKNELPDVVLSQLSAGAVFGEISLMDKRPRSTNVSSVGEVVVMKLDKITIGKLPLIMQNKLHQRFISILIRRLDEMNEKYLRASRPTKDSI
ncbi:MAG: cyclic nucleotide-binding domain-containing protein [Nitrospinales bacterium]